MALPLYQVDAFTDRPFAGNPAAVCLLTAPAAAGWMQQVAQEMNLSETAFVWPEADGFHLRWFTPTVEVDLCGHATLAAAHVLWQTDHLPESEAARFHTRSGLLVAHRLADWIRLDFPATPAAPVTAPAQLLPALGVTDAVQVGKSAFDYLVEVADPAVVTGLRPDYSALAALPARGIIVTSPSPDPAYDFISRFFAPAAGVPEDPVTGSAHSCLAPYWAERLGKRQMTAFQASSRGGVIRVALVADRVHLEGQAVTVLRGTLMP